MEKESKSLILTAIPEMSFNTLIKLQQPTAEYLCLFLDTLW